MDKREVFDYLRNQQKAAEIESKVNGVNVWVLLAAIALMFWKLIGIADAKLLADSQAMLRALLVGSAIYILAITSSPSRLRFGEARYSNTPFIDTRPSMLELAYGLLLMAPPMLCLLFVERDVPTALLLIPGLLATGFCLASLAAAVLEHQSKVGRFPPLVLQPGRRQRAIVQIAVTSLSIYVALVQIFQLASHGISTTFAKSLILIATLYVLGAYVIGRMLRSHEIRWSYDLETSLLTGEVSPEIAVRRIENRELGRSLREVMDRFFDEMDGHFATFEKAKLELNNCVESIKTIPAEYSIERAARIENLAEPARASLKEAAIADMEFQEYAQKLKKYSLAPTKEKSSALLQSLVAREDVNRTRLKKAERELDDLVRHLRRL